MPSRVRVPEGISYTSLEGEIVLLNRRDGRYFSLDATGARMWELLVENGELVPTLEALLAEFDASRERLEADLESFVAELTARRLIEVEER